MSTPVDKAGDCIPPWAAWLVGTPGVAVALLWGFAEGTLFFILPDVPLSLAALYRARRSLLQVAAIVVGAVLGGAVMFMWSINGAGARAAVGNVPLVAPGMFAHADRDFREYGLWAVAKGPAARIPYKVYAVEAPAFARLGPFLLASIPARLWRLLLVWLAAAAAGAVLRKLGRASLIPGVHATVWILVYVAYWASVWNYR